MFFLTYSSVWSLTFFFLLTYTVLVFSIMFYVLPVLSTSTRYLNFKNSAGSDVVNGFDYIPVLIMFIVFPLTAVLLWSAPSVSVWFGHLVITNFQIKMQFFIFAIFSLVLTTLVLNFYFSTQEVYDYVITLYGFLYWISLLFYANSLFTVIFTIEVLSSLVFLYLVVSTFSSAFFYRNIDLSFGNFFNTQMPYNHLKSIIFYFWVSLISSLNLFFFIILLYTKLLTFDWYVLEYVLSFFITTNSFKSILGLGVIWFILIMSIFLKCAIAPLFLWKPTFFKGLPIYTIFYYITFFYFFLFLFILTLLDDYLGSVLRYYVLINVTVVLMGLVTLLTILCETFYFKSFMAISSILNSLFVFLALSTNQTNSLYLLL